MAQVVLSAGPTHYALEGAEGSPLVVLVHGISMPSWNWDHMAPALVRAGFRVLRYDVYGRGESAYPNRPYDRALLSAQLLELLDQLGFAAPVNLAGFSFGGALSANFTAQHPQRVARLALVAPFARMEQPDRRNGARLPLVGELAMRFKLPAELRLRAQRLLRESPTPEAHAARFAQQVRRPEFRRAFLSLMRTDGLDDYGAVYEAVAKCEVPTALIWGAGDIDISRASIEYARSKLRPGEYHEMAGADHGSIIQAGHGLDRILDRFFGGGQAQASGFPA